MVGTMQRFDELAAGARELDIKLDRGDIRVRVAEGAEWTLETSSDGEGLSEVERDGPAIRVRQRSPHWEHVQVEMVMPPGVKAVELGTGVGRIEVEGLRGRLRVKSGNGPIILRASGGDGEIASGNGAVQADGYEGALKVSNGNGSTVVARLDGQMDVHSGNGRVEIADAAGHIRARTGNGDVVLKRVAGEAEVQTGHGAVEVEASRELSLRATSSMGTIRVTGGSLRGLALKTTMGAIVSTARLVRGRYELETAMGSATLELPSDVSAHVEAQTGFGQVHSDFPLVRVGRSGPMGFGGVRMVGSIGSDEPAIAVVLRSGKGDLHLRRAQAGRAAGAAEPSPQGPAVPSPEPATAPAARPARPPRPSRGDPVLAILEAVARGEISPAEADDLLSQR